VADTRLPAAVLRKIAVAAAVDPRTVEREFFAALGRGPHARGDAGARARAALSAAGLLPDTRGAND